MNEREARAEAKRRWHVHGGWAEEIETFPYPSDPYRVKIVCCVGILEPASLGIAKKTLGRAHNFEEAFARAEDYIKDTRIREAKKQFKHREPEPWALPQLDLFA